MLKEHSFTFFAKCFEKTAEIEDPEMQHCLNNLIGMYHGFSVQQRCEMLKWQKIQNSPLNQAFLSIIGIEVEVNQTIVIHIRNCRDWVLQNEAVVDIQQNPNGSRRGEVHSGVFGPVYVQEVKPGLWEN